MFWNKNKGNSNFDYLIVGLGNPGRQYEMTRHNAGFLAVELLSVKENFEIRKLKYNALICDVTIDDKRCLIMKPQTFMNNSGEAVSAAASFYKIPPQNVIVLFDDISLDVGKIRVRRKGSAGGHNGIKSIISHLGSDEFPRIKIGVGKKPNPEYDLADWVLGTFPKDKEKDLKVALENAIDALKLMIDDKTEKAMNTYNS